MVVISNRMNESTHKKTLNRKAVEGWW